MKSGGSSSGKGPKNDPVPQGAPITPYGQSTPFNPTYNSILPDDPLQTAQLGDPMQSETGAATPLLEQQQATTMTQTPTSTSTAGPPGAPGDAQRKMLAALMMKVGQSPAQGYNAAGAPGQPARGGGGGFY